MKFILVTLILTVSICSFAQAQEKSDKKITESIFHVDGVCEMCKKRIEEAALRTPGVKLAVWNKQTKELRVVYKNNKTTQTEIQKVLANVGHASKGMEADSVEYEALPACCKYNDGVETH